jgi:hypothetical protein
MGKPKHMPTDQETLTTLQAVALADYDGHLTIMRFTTNWRVGFFTPNDREDIQQLAVGRSFAEAAAKALAD